MRLFGRNGLNRNIGKESSSQNKFTSISILVTSSFHTIAQFLASILLGQCITTPSLSTSFCLYLAYSVHTRYHYTTPTYQQTYLHPTTLLCRVVHLPHYQDALRCSTGCCHTSSIVIRSSGSTHSISPNKSCICSDTSLSRPHAVNTALMPHCATYRKPGSDGSARSNGGDDVNRMKKAMPVDQMSARLGS